jgi:histidine ammonia-lyase
MMILQYTAAALVNKNTILAAPAGLHSAVVSAGQEDHASMGVTSALKAREIIINSTRVVAIELMCACQAVEMLGQAKLGEGSQVAIKRVRKLTKHLVDDRSLSTDLERLAEYLQKGEFVKSVLNAVRED